MRFSTIIFLLTLTAPNAYTLPVNCAPNSGIMTTPTYGTTNAIFTVCAQTTIYSPPSPIYNILIDFPRYAAWNTFVYSVDVPSNVSSAEDVSVGMPMTFHTFGLIPVVNSTSNERITFLEPRPDSAPAFIGWRFDLGALGELQMQAEHVSVLHDLGGGTTEYVSWETYYGAGAVTVLLLKGSLQREFDDQARDLKTRVEA
jgi:hypothetical protein